MTARDRHRDRARPWRSGFPTMAGRAPSRTAGTGGHEDRFGERALAEIGGMPQATEIQPMAAPIRAAGIGVCSQQFRDRGTAIPTTARVHATSAGQSRPGRTSSANRARARRRRPPRPARRAAGRVSSRASHADRTGRTRRPRRPGEGGQIQLRNLALAEPNEHPIAVQQQPHHESTTVANAPANRDQDGRGPG
jgi:hypothetical protein